jgi:hypothetical protein
MWFLLLALLAFADAAPTCTDVASAERHGMIVIALANLILLIIILVRVRWLVKDLTPRRNPDPNLSSPLIAKNPDYGGE